MVKKSNKRFVTLVLKYSLSLLLFSPEEISRSVKNHHGNKSSER